MNGFWNNNHKINWFQYGFFSTLNLIKIYIKRTNQWIYTISNQYSPMIQQ